MSEHTMSGAVASPHYLATKVGTEILIRGGNAFDAAVAVALAIGVVQPYHSGIGGGCTITFMSANGERGVIQSRGSAPAQLQPELFWDLNGKPDYELVKAGGLAIAVPGLIAGLRDLHKARGQLSWSVVCLAPYTLAQNGFYADFLLARYSQMPSNISKLSRFAQGTPFGRMFQEGERVKQTRLATTLATLAHHPENIYSGGIGEQIASHVQQIGGVLTVDDLAEYSAQSQTLCEGSYRNWTLYAPAMPTIGALQTLFALQVLDQFDLGELSFGSGTHLHLVAEAIKLSYMVRAGLDTIEDAMQLADRELAQTQAERIRLDRPMLFKQLSIGSSSIPAGAAEAISDGESCTSHFSVADSAGNVVSQTQTVRSYFGSGVVEPRTGILLNDIISDFSLREGDLTTQGIRNGRYNLVAPGATAASSQSPVIAVNPNTGESLAVGAAGGPKIVSATVQALVNCIDFGMDAHASVRAPRIHCHSPEIEIEPGVAAAEQLEALGHPLKPVSSIAIMQLVGSDGRQWDAASDPRGPGASGVLLAKGGVNAVRTYGYSY